MAKKPLIGNKTGKQRDERGRFVTGNNGGGRTKLPEEIKQMCRDLTPDAISVAARIMMDEDEKASDRLRAVEIILERAWGKPEQAIKAEEGDIPALGIVLMPPRSDG